MDQWKCFLRKLWFLVEVLCGCFHLAETVLNSWYHIAVQRSGQVKDKIGDQSTAVPKVHLMAISAPKHYQKLSWDHKSSDSEQKWKVTVDLMIYWPQFSKRQSTLIFLHNMQSTVSHSSPLQIPSEESHSQLLHVLTISSTLDFVLPERLYIIQIQKEIHRFPMNLCTLKTIVWSLGNPSLSFTILWKQFWQTTEI